MKKKPIPKGSHISRGWGEQDIRPRRGRTNTIYNFFKGCIPLGYEWYDIPKLDDSHIQWLGDKKNRSRRDHKFPGVGDEKSRSFFKNKINRQNQKPKSNQMIHPKRFVFKDKKRKNGKNHQSDYLLNDF